MIVSLALGIPAVIVLIKTVGQPYLAQELERQVRENCASCKLTVGRVHISLSRPGNFTLRRVRIEAGHTERMKVEAKIRSIKIKPAFWPILKGSKQIEIENLKFDGVEVTLSDTSGPKPPPTPPNDPSPYTIQINHTRLRDGKFTYIRNQGQSHAVLNIHHIQATLGEVGDGAEFLTKMAEGHASAQIEKSGQVQVDVSTYLLRKAPYIDVRVHAKNQVLDDLTPFFKENAGVLLTGEMLDGTGQVFIRDNHLKSEVKARYKNFKVSFDSKRERTALTAFFMNLGSAITMRKEDVDSAEVADKGHVFETEREPDEPIVGFVLRGLKEAALKVAQNRQ